MKDSRSGDTVQRIIQTTKSGGIVKYLLITGTDTAEIRWDGTALLIEGYNIQDSIDLHTDTLQAHNIRINSNTTARAITDNYVVIGTGTGIEGTNKFQYDDTGSSELLTVTGKITILGTGGSVFIGPGAGADDDLTSNNNIGIGLGALGTNITGYENVALGFGALSSGESPFRNVAIGAYSLQNATTGIHNVASGVSSLNQLTEGTHNTAIGSSAFLGLTTGKKNVGLGNECSLSAVDDTNSIVIGHEAIGNGPDTFTAGDDNVTDVYMNEDGTATVHAGEYMLTTDFKIIIFNDTMCGVKISTTDTVRIVPTR